MLLLSGNNCGLQPAHPLYKPPTSCLLLPTFLKEKGRSQSELAPAGPVFTDCWIGSIKQYRFDYSAEMETSPVDSLKMTK